MHFNESWYQFESKTTRHIYQTQQNQTNELLSLRLIKLFSKNHTPISIRNLNSYIRHTRMKTSLSYYDTILVVRYTDPRGIGIDKLNLTDPFLSPTHRTTNLCDPPPQSRVTFYAYLVASVVSRITYAQSRTRGRIDQRFIPHRYDDAERHVSASGRDAATMNNLILVIRSNIVRRTISSGV